MSLGAMETLGLQSQGFSKNRKKLWRFRAPLGDLQIDAVARCRQV